MIKTKQTKLMSVIEQLVNTLVGFIISIILLKFLFPEITNSKSFITTLIFTIVSIVRGYLIRRIFNRL